MVAKPYNRSKVKDPKDSFEQTAKRLECDEDKGRFEKKLGNIAKTKPKRAASK